MECVDTGSFILSMVWSTLMVIFVVKMDRLNGFESGLKDVFSTPIISSLLLTCVFVYFFYDAPPTQEQRSLGGLAERASNFFEYITCSFVMVLNYWGLILMLIGVYKVIQKQLPNEVEAIKSKIKSWFGD
ncbi:hypothetical protein [Colwellia sp. UCD-KL20]|uniref:hypothetical protein n=1 Tax=Colwellia sp. UCD-KL20 TaxID=1917165 RepID=UPI00117886B8|nr:hypothetical protein [Colwellia sp. UCD-KL20]